MSLKFWFAFVLGISVAASAGAQDGDNKEQPPGPENSGLARGGDVEMIGPLRILVQEVKLDDEQMDKVRNIWNAHAQAEKKLREELRPSPELTEKMGELRREMRVAHDARDKEKVEDIRKQLEVLQTERTNAMTPLREKLDELQGKLHDDLLKVMRPDQVELFEQVWGEQLDRREIRRAFLRSPNALKSAVDRLKDLTPGQTKAVQAHFEEFKLWMRQAREKPDEYASGRKARIKKLYEDVLNQLTPEQRELVTKELEPDHRSERRDGRTTERPQRPRPTRDKAESEQGGGETENSGEKKRGG